MRIIWRGREVVNRVTDTLANRMEALGALMEGDIKDDLGEPGPTKTHPGGMASAPGEAPHRRSGELRRSIAHELQRHPVPILRVGTNTKYAKWLELGTSAYVIRPKKARILAWKGADGQWIFAREVHHPGIRPRPFLRPALLRAQRDIDRILRRGRW